MRRRLLLSRRAERDLEDIWVYTFERWGEVQADRSLEAIGESLHLLETRPERGRKSDALRPGYRSWLVRRHVVFCTVADDEVFIQRVLHGSMDPRRHLLDDVGE